MFQIKFGVPDFKKEQVFCLLLVMIFLKFVILAMTNHDSPSNIE